MGEDIEIVGIKPTAKSTVTGIEMFNKSLQEGQAGDNAGILLRGTRKEDVHRGQVIAKPGSVTPHTDFEAEVYVLKKEEGGRHTPFSMVINRNSTSERLMLQGRLLFQKRPKWLCPETRLLSR